MDNYGRAGIGHGIGQLGNFIAQLLLYKAKMEDEKELKDVRIATEKTKQELLKAQAQQAKRDAGLYDQLGPILQRLQAYNLAEGEDVEYDTPQTTPGAATSLLPPNIGPGQEKPKQGFSDMASQMELLQSLAPYSSVIERVSGFNPQDAFENRLDVQKFNQRTQQDERNFQQRLREFEAKQGEVEYHTYIDEKTGNKVEEIVNKKTKEPVSEPKVIEPLKGESADASARIALANRGKQHLTNLKSMFINPDGSINKKIIYQASLPFGGVGEGRTAYATFLDALDARARAATGAAMPDTEIKNYTRMYFPSPLDNAETVKDKLKRLEGFLTDYLETLDPSGLIRKRINKIKTESGPPDMVFNPQTGRLEPAR